MELLMAVTSKGKPSGYIHIYTRFVLILTSETNIENMVSFDE
jgi:hypothetical protein